LLSKGAQKLRSTIRKASTPTVFEASAKCHGVDHDVKAANVKVQPTSKSALTDSLNSYASADFAHLCGDDYREHPYAPGPISQTLRFNWFQIDTYVTQPGKKEDFGISRFSRR
jgi:hypothetical protein